MKKEGIRVHKKCAAGLRGEGREGHIDLAIGAGVKQPKLNPEGTGLCLKVSRHRFSAGIGGVERHGDGSGLGRKLAQQAEPLGRKLVIHGADPGGVASWAIEADDEACSNRVAGPGEHDRDGRGRGLGRERRRLAGDRNNDPHLPPDQVGRQFRQPVVLATRPAIFGRHVPAFDKARVAQARAKSCQTIGVLLLCTGVQKPDHRCGQLLRARRDRPHRRAGRARTKSRRLIRSPRRQARAAGPEFPARSPSRP